MKRLIANNFLYYVKNKSKMLLSLAFILSFFIMLNVYDSNELKQNNIDAYNTREMAVDFRSYFIMGVNDANQDPLQEAAMNVYSSLGNYSFLLSAGRSNYFLTPQRQQLNEHFISFYNAFGADTYNSIDSTLPIETLLIEQERYDQLMNYLIPDDFNHYTITAANSISKIFEGNFLLLIMVFSLVLFHDLFAKDFDTKTYRHLYTTSHSRSKIIVSKILFALIYIFILIFIASSLLIVYLFIVKRNEYNTVPSRIGDLRHLKLVNLRWLSTFDGNIKHGLISNAKLNVLSFLIGSSILTLWIITICYLSFKLKSSNNTLVVATYAVIAIFAMNLTSLKSLLSYFIPFFAYEYHDYIYGEQAMHVSYIMLLCIVFSTVILYLFLRNAKTIDLLDGDHSD